MMIGVQDPTDGPMMRGSGSGPSVGSGGTPSGGQVLHGTGMQDVGSGGTPSGRQVLHGIGMQNIGVREVRLGMNNLL